MADRPNLDRNLSSAVFREYYYLKEELVDFLRENGLPYKWRKGGISG